MWNEILSHILKAFQMLPNDLQMMFHVKSSKWRESIWSSEYFQILLNDSEWFPVKIDGHLELLHTYVYRRFEYSRWNRNHSNGYMFIYSFAQSVYIVLSMSLARASISSILIWKAMLFSCLAAIELCSRSSSWVDFLADFSSRSVAIVSGYVERTSEHWAVLHYCLRVCWLHWAVLSAASVFQAFVLC
jgi:hypothetical protein